MTPSRGITLARAGLPQPLVESIRGERTALRNRGPFRSGGPHGRSGVSEVWDHVLGQ
jgi:hypothetical protein